MTDQLSFRATSSNVPIQNAAIDKSEQSLGTELADRVETVGGHTARLQELEQEDERDQRARTFAEEVEKCKGIGLSFSGEPGPSGNYRVAGSLVDPTPRDLALLYRLAVAAASVGEVRIVADVVRIAKKSKLNFDDPEYPIWRQIYEAAYERLDPKSPAAVALKKEFGA